MPSMRCERGGSRHRALARRSAPSIASDDSRKAQVAPLRPGQKRAEATKILIGAAVRTSTIIPLLKASLKFRLPIIGKAREHARKHPTKPKGFFLASREAGN